MSSIRSDRLYLDDIIASADAIARYLAGFDRDRFLSDEVMCDAVLRRLIVIGEAASRVSADLRARHPAVAWGSARDFRNFAVHGYFSLEWSIVWETAVSDVPKLRFAIATVRAVEFPEHDT